MFLSSNRELLFWNSHWHFYETDGAWTQTIKPNTRWYHMLLHLCVDYSSHPEPFAGPRHGQHGPEEDEDGQDEREERSRHNVVEDDDKVTQHLWLGHHCVIEGKHQLHESGQCQEKPVRLWDLLVLKHAVKKERVEYESVVVCSLLSLTREPKSFLNYI